LAKQPRNLTGQVAAITGGARGIGKTTAEAFVRQGMKVAIGDLDLDEAQRTADELGAGTVAFRLDVTDRESFAQFLDDAEQALGPIDVLVNNAGLEFVGPYAEAPLAQIDLITKVNLLTPMELTRIALPGMLERRRGHIVNLASLAGKTSLAYFHTYNATKHGVVGFTHAIRHELVDQPVSTTVICPAFIAREGMYGRVEQEIGAENPLGASPPEKVGEAVVRAVQDDPAEIIISERPVRALVALAAVAPRAAIWVNEKIGARRAAREMGEAYGRF
jgi:NADP-dependent 3-hydroxy acid dehydrogenase YdfG